MIRGDVKGESNPPITLYVIIALIAGLLAGGGAVFLLKRRR
jgi:uncharacterized protein involved in exopolysaccharide biosynthesis